VDRRPRYIGANPTFFIIASVDVISCAKPRVKVALSCRSTLLLMAQRSSFSDQQCVN